MFEEFITPTGRLSARAPLQVRNAWFIPQFTAVHGNTYDYSETNCGLMREEITIKCKIHGQFKQRLNVHLKGSGCPKCANCHKKTNQEQILNFQQIHGTLYDYSLLEYKNTDTKITIICRIHGEFQQTPNHHLRGTGCPQCKNIPDSLYILKCNNTELIKIGITKNMRNRIKSIGGSVLLLDIFKVKDPRSLEKALHERFKDYNRFNNTVNNGGTEFFQLSDQQLISLLQELRMQ